MSRDLQKQKVYEAGWTFQSLAKLVADGHVQFCAIGGSEIVLPVERKFGDIESVQRYVDAVLALPSLRETYAMASVPVKVRERKGEAKAHYTPYQNTISVPPHQGSRTSWAMRETVVLHELAHHLSAFEPEAHGPKFASAMVDLFRVAMGEEAGFALQVIMHETGVAFG